MADEPEQSLVEASVALFGLTDDPRECGYILPDGRMLDLSGRHYDSAYVRRGDRYVVRRGRDYQAGSRLVDHRELGDLVVAGGTDGMLEFMIRSGAVRAIPSQGFTVMRDPTPRQIALMCAISRFYGDEAYVEVYDGNGDVLSFGSAEEMMPKDVLRVLREGGLMGGNASPAP